MKLKNVHDRIEKEMEEDRRKDAARNIQRSHCMSACSGGV
jgi:hypothetical protein